MRREERVTVQGPVKEQQPDGMSHRGAPPWTPSPPPLDPPPPKEARRCLWVTVGTLLVRLDFPVSKSCGALYGGAPDVARAWGAEIWPPILTKQLCLPPRGFLSLGAVLGGG